MAGEGSSALDWCQRLYERRAAALLLYGRALGLGHAEAEDVLQATFEALLRLPAPPDNPDHYCLRAFRNRALNHRRGWLARLRRELESARWFEPSPDETELERAAMRQLAALPAPQREAIVLKLWHERTFEEIGELLRISPNTAAGRYRYGIEKLRNTVTRYDYERLEPTGNADAFVDVPATLAAGCHAVVRQS